MLIAKIKVDRRGRVQLPSCFVKANDWDESGSILLKNHTQKDKVVLEYVRLDEKSETIEDKIRDHKSADIPPHEQEMTINDVVQAMRP